MVSNIFLSILTVFVLLYLAPQVSLQCLSNTYNQACKNVFNPHAMDQSCCKPMNEFVDIINTCQKQSNGTVFSCEVSKCVTQQYGILTNDTIDEEKVTKELVTLDEEDPTSEPLNEEIRTNCLNGQFKKYVPSDANCETMMFQVCAFVNYLMGCQEFDSTPCRCKHLSRSVGICKPVLQQYLEQPTSCLKQN